MMPPWTHRMDTPLILARPQAPAAGYRVSLVRTPGIMQAARTADGDGAVGMDVFAPPALPDDAGSSHSLLRLRFTAPPDALARCVLLRCRWGAAVSPVPGGLPAGALSGGPSWRSQLHATLEKVELGLVPQRLAERVRAPVETARRLAEPVQAQHPRFPTGHVHVLALFLDHVASDANACNEFCMMPS